MEATNAIKEQARQAVTNAVKRGILVRPKRCSNCFKGGRVEGHHRSYAREFWLAVLWLCPTCHHKEHGNAAPENLEIWPDFDEKHVDEIQRCERHITRRQADILTFIIDSAERVGLPPTIREIGQRFKIRSTNGVNDHLKALERKVYIERGTLISRGLRVLKYPDGTPYQRAA